VGVEELGEEEGVEQEVPGIEDADLEKERSPKDGWDLCSVSLPWTNGAQEGPMCCCCCKDTAAALLESTAAAAGMGMEAEAEVTPPACFRHLMIVADCSIEGIANVAVSEVPAE
jgi:hypothetical protein